MLKNLSAVLFFLLFVSVLAKSESAVIIENSLSATNVVTNSKGYIFVAGKADPASGSSLYLEMRDPESELIWRRDFQSYDFSYILSMDMTELKDLPDLEMFRDVKYSKEFTLIAVSGFYLDSLKLDSRKVLSNPGQNAFAAVFDSQGNLIFAKSLGDGEFESDKMGAGGESANAIRIDNRGNVIVAGYFTGTIDLDPDDDQDYEDTYFSKPGDTGPSQDLFLASYRLDGTYNFGFTIGGAGIESAEYLEIDERDDIYVIGNFQGNINFNPDGMTPLESTEESDIFVGKYDVNGAFWAAGSFYDENYEYYVFAEGSELNDKKLLICDSDSKCVYFNEKLKTITRFALEDSYQNALDAYEMAGFTFDRNDRIIMAYKPMLNILNNSGEKIKGIKFEISEEESSSEYQLMSGPAVDPANNIIVGGTFKGKVDFDPSKRELFLESKAEGGRGFIVKLDESGRLWESPFDAFYKKGTERKVHRINPNEIEATIKLEYELKRPSEARVYIGGEDNRVIRDFFSGYREPGKYEVEWDGKDLEGDSLPCGVVFLVTQIGDTRKFEKIIITN